MLTVRHKRGATLSYSGAITDDAGDAVDLTGYTLTAEVRSADRELVSTATVTVATPSSGLFTVEVAAADTAGWTAGARLLFDVRVQSASARVDYTETIAIDVVEAMTRRRLADVRRRLREQPETVGDLLASAIAEDREVVLTGEQVIALVWWVEGRSEEASA